MGRSMQRAAVASHSGARLPSPPPSTVAPMLSSQGPFPTLPNPSQDISEVPKHRLVEIRRFFEDYKKNEHKEVQVRVLNRVLAPLLLASLSRVLCWRCYAACTEAPACALPLGASLSARPLDLTPSALSPSTLSRSTRSAAARRQSRSWPRRWPCTRTSTCPSAAATSDSWSRL